jgi:hypothetical protein
LLGDSNGNAAWTSTYDEQVSNNIN